MHITIEFLSQQSWAYDCRWTLTFETLFSTKLTKEGWLADVSKALCHLDTVAMYPNIDIALQMNASVPAANCKGEKSFSAHYWLSTT